MRSLERAAYSSRILWDAMGKVMRRQGGGLPIQPLGTTLPIVWPCADGHVVFYIFGGQMGMISNPALAAWMDEEGLAPEEMKSLDWPSLDLGRMPQEEADRRLVEPVAAFSPATPRPSFGNKGCGGGSWSTRSTTPPGSWPTPTWPSGAFG